MKPNAELKKQIDARWSELDKQFSTWEQHYMEVKQNVLPWNGRGLDHQGTYEYNRGDKKQQKIFDSVPSRALGVLASGMQSGLTSPARPWFIIKPSNPDLNDVYTVKKYVDEVTRRMLTVFGKSNLYNSLHQLYIELAGFGTASMAVQQDFNDIIRCRTFTTGEFRLILDHHGRVTGFYRKYNSTIGQVVEQFGKENCSEAVVKAYDLGKLEDAVRIGHIIEKNDSRIKIKEILNRPFRSIYYEIGKENLGLLEISGYEEMPVMGCRWNPVANDTYSTSPSMDMLPDIKTLYKLVKKYLIATDKVIDPPLKASSSLRKSMINLIPGGVTFYNDMNGSGGLEPLYNVNFDLNAAQAKILDLRQSISQGYYNDLFLMLAGLPPNHQMTATEVAQRHEEKLMMLGTVIHRLHSELLNPLIDRTYNIMYRMGALPEAPVELQGADLKIEYISILAQAQKMVGITGMERFLGFAGNISSVFPEVLDKINPDEALDEYADAQGVAASVLRPDEEVQAIREQRRLQQEQQANAEAALAVADGAKTLSETPVGNNSALDMLMNRPQQ